MRQIADWLEKLGMSEMRSILPKTALTFQVVPDLTDQDLRDNWATFWVIAAKY